MCMYIYIYHDCLFIYLFIYLFSNCVRIHPNVFDTPEEGRNRDVSFDRLWRRPFRSPALKLGLRRALSGGMREAAAVVVRSKRCC